MCRMQRHRPAPSSCAASTSSRGVPDSRALSSTTKKPAFFHTNSARITARSCAPLSQITRPTPNAPSSRLTTPL